MSQDVKCHPSCPLRSDRIETSGSAPESEHGPPIGGVVPFRSPLREEVLEKICDHCWQEWLRMQIKVINEFALNLGDPRSHDIIEAHARDFLGFSETPTIDFSTLGETPPPGSETTTH